MKKVYFISGLGADKRVFSYLDLSFCEPVFIDWINPLQNETLHSYAARLRQSIDEEHPTVVGLSLGGMLAAEMAAMDEKIKAIIIASNRSSKEFPALLRFLKYIPLYKLIPGFVLKNTQRMYTYAFGVKDKAHKKILYQVIADSDMRFVKWAINAIVHWRYQQPPGNIIHIHGTADRLLSVKKVKADHIVKGGTHVMTLDQHKEVSFLLRQLI
jgi:pimeloyl-ACP methyl ester carboxylesterase